MRLLLTILVLGVVPFVLLRKMGRNGRSAPACKAGNTSA
jgi:hypothetical protein